MDLILGMDPWVFAAWILTILSSIFCILYGVYHEFIKKSSKNNEKENKKDDSINLEGK